LYFSPNAVIVENVQKHVDTRTQLEVVEYAKDEVKSTKRPFLSLKITI